MNENNPNNLYNLESERKRLEEVRKRRKKDEKASPGKRTGGSKIAHYGQVVFFLFMIGLLMYQCGIH